MLWESRPEMVLHRRVKQFMKSLEPTKQVTVKIFTLFHEILFRFPSLTNSLIYIYFLLSDVTVTIHCSSYKYVKSHIMPVKPGFHWTQGQAGAGCIKGV